MLDQRRINTFTQSLPWISSLLIGTLCGTAMAGEVPPKVTDAEKLAMILNGKNEFPRAYRIQTFGREGEIDAVGRLVTIGKTVYFKTADQSFIPQEKRFPYPELFLELHLSEAHAYKPMLTQDMVRKRHVVYDGPIRVQGNWAYEPPYHIFGLVWVDEVSRVEESPEADWGPWLEKQASTKNSSGAKP